MRRTRGQLGIGPSSTHAQSHAQSHAQAADGFPVVLLERADDLLLLLVHVLRQAVERLVGPQLLLPRRRHLQRRSLLVLLQHVHVLELHQAELRGSLTRVLIHHGAESLELILDGRLLHRHRLLVCCVGGLRVCAREETVQRSTDAAAAMTAFAAGSLDSEPRLRASA